MEMVSQQLDYTGSLAVLRKSEKADPAVRPVHLAAAAGPLVRRGQEQPVWGPGPALPTSHPGLPQVIVFIVFNCPSSG